jgi:hypothetical protein
MAAFGNEEGLEGGYGEDSKGEIEIEEQGV